MEAAAVRCSNQKPAGAEGVVLEVRTLWPGTLEPPSCTEAMLVWDGTSTGDWQEPKNNKDGDRHYFPFSSRTNIRNISG